MIHAYLGLPKAPGREKLTLNQRPAPDNMTLGAEPGDAAALPGMLLQVLSHGHTANVPAEDSYAAFPGSINHQFHLVSALCCRMLSMHLLESLQQHDI